ncbi:flagellum-specific peptidoglycan hydrolase FlgJ [Kineothrix alysoides]|uniref:Flagellum-specific peptidoglycan hydrolase FlgJ n=1 Tax=Kineothrix alysoides TaxID=1469948 RepID=A0A4R1R4M5_9FIRM|nr:N-acetylmuramoyl-L-alanine amidase [Kineothrix alysoides]TCL60409.1 flagellum-specific peptidoglycan hydrolase FlgJ [Kineothrix alysoides]
MTIGINCGHTIGGAGYGAVGLIKESNHTRLVGYALMEKLKAAGVKVVDCTIDEANTQAEYLAAAVALGNREDLDWFISLHFNASAAHTGQGVEVYTYEGRQYQDALDVCSNIAAYGFKNRGVKAGTGLYVIKNTKAKAMLIEVCFCDNQADVDLYNRIGGADTIAQAIFNGIYDYVVKPEDMSAEKHDIPLEDFMEFVGEVARQDWLDRKIMLPSVVVAQAIKESARGTSELAQKANALFGIKKNGWTGKTYRKAATEQRSDGSYYTVDNTEWRSYGSWKESILDHNTYIAERSTDGGKTLRYGPVIGREEYVLACQYLQDLGYATSLTYAESLINDYIEKYNLTRFDTADDEIAPEGKLWIVQLGAYKSRNNAESFIRKLETMGVISMLKLYDTNEEASM